MFILPVLLTLIFISQTQLLATQNSILEHTDRSAQFHYQHFGEVQTKPSITDSEKSFIPS